MQTQRHICSQTLRNPIKTAGFYELTGTTSKEELAKAGYEFVCFANTKKEAEKISRSLWEAK